MSRPHLAAALLALLVGGLAVAGFATYAAGVEAGVVHSLAPSFFPLKLAGSALQRRAVDAPDLLPIYGSSELNIGDPYHANQLFRTLPTGFTIFPVGKPGTTDLIILENLAAAGNLQGKKVAISLSATWFLGSQGEDSYAGNFSDLHANALAWHPGLSLVVKQEAAVRMLHYPKTLEHDTLLRLGLQWLAGGRPWQQALYYAALPLGQLHLLVLELQDHWETLHYIRSPGKKLPPPPQRKAGDLNWPQLLTRATQEQAKNANNNNFGFDNNAYLKNFKEQVAKAQRTRTDASFRQSLARSPEFSDLELLLRALKELGAEPLVLSMPYQGTYWNYTGVTRAARQAYYDRLEQMGREQGVPVRDFADHDEDRFFLIDPGAHLSRRGWIYYDQALDEFYHGRLH